MATFLMRLLGLFDIRPGDFPPAGFTDTAGSPHEGAIDAAVELGIAQGTSAPRRSRPPTPVSRAQMATFLVPDPRSSLSYDLAAPGPDAFDDDDGNPHEARHPGRSPTSASPAAPHPACTTRAAPSAGGRWRRSSSASIDLGIEQGVYPPFITSAVARRAARRRGSPEATSDAAGTAVVATTDVPGRPLRRHRGRRAWRHRPRPTCTQATRPTAATGRRRAADAALGTPRACAAYRPTPTPTPSRPTPVASTSTSTTSSFPTARSAASSARSPSPFAAELQRRRGRARPRRRRRRSGSPLGFTTTPTRRRLRRRCSSSARTTVTAVPPAPGAATRERPRGARARARSTPTRRRVRRRASASSAV